MSRLIDADKLKDIAGNNLRKLGFYEVVINAANQIIDEQPTIYARPVIYSHWEWNPDHCQYKCSHCGGGESTCETPFCKWCGAKMDETKKSNDLCKMQIENIVPVVHAHWEYDPNGMDWNLGAWKCSKCGCKNNNIGVNDKIRPLMFAGSKFCPNCGAIMDESEGEHEI